MKTPTDHAAEGAETGAAASAQAPDPRRVQRRLLISAAVAAGAAGLGWGAWRYRLTPIAPAAANGVWGMSFDQPQGSQALQMAAFKGRPLLLNFWATWCPPCVEEMPLLDAFFKQHASNGWQVVGLAVDQKAPVQAFLQRLPVTFPIGLAGLAGADLGRELGNQSGGLPYTVVFGRDGAVIQRKMGQVSQVDLDHWLQAAGG